MANKEHNTGQINKNIDKKQQSKVALSNILKVLADSDNLEKNLKAIEETTKRINKAELDTQAKLNVESKKEREKQKNSAKDLRKAKEKETKLDTQVADRMGLGSDGSVRGKISSMYKGTHDTQYFKTLTSSEKMASTVMKSAVDKSALLSNSLGLLTGAINPATAAMGVLAWAVGEAIDAFVEGYNQMNEVQKQAAYTTSFQPFETAVMSKQYIGAAGLLNAGIADLSSMLSGPLKDTFEGSGIAIDRLEGMVGTAMQGLSITRITSSEALKTFQNVIKEFKDANIIYDMKFAKLAVGLEEMGYSISGPLGQIMKTQYYRDEKSMNRTNELLNKLVGLSKTSSLSLDELVSIMSETIAEQNVSAWTLIRAGVGEKQATNISTGFGTSKASISAAADTLGLSKGGVDAIFNVISEIISAATDPTKLGELTKKLQVGGLTGGSTISQMYDQIASGNFNDVFKKILSSAVGTAKDKSGLPFGYIESQFGSNIKTILESFSPTTVGQLLEKVDDMAINITDTGRGDAELLGEIQSSIISAPITVEDILNTFFDKFVQFGMDVSSFFTTVTKWLNPASWFDGVADIFSDVGKSITDAVDSFTSISKAGMLSAADTAIIKQNSALFQSSVKASPMSEFSGSQAQYFEQIAGTIRSQLNPTPTTETPGGVGTALNLSDYYANDSSGWFVNNDIKGRSPFQLTAGYMAPAYKKEFGSDHQGVDYGARTGTPIPSTVDGEIVATGYNTASGNYVKVQDASGRVHTFAHMSKISVKKGDRVTRGSTLGLVGATGKATGPHVHYAVKQNGRAINPNTWAGYSFGGITANSGAMGGADDGGAIAMATKSSAEPYYNSSEIVSSINDLNSMLANKLDVIIAKMQADSRTPISNQFIYK